MVSYFSEANYSIVAPFRLNYSTVFTKKLETSGQGKPGFLGIWSGHHHLLHQLWLRTKSGVIQWPTQNQAFLIFLGTRDIKLLFGSDRSSRNANVRSFVRSKIV